ncbi:hypothetical protein GCM10010170_030740 [Dactylosporangium salmoneum]|uniref:Uncharacterized protein n=1 Tax=Dactylosporangium salmoneum TaxID=53361 RepID=A0ABN3G5Z6_9ACTN
MASGLRFPAVRVLLSPARLLTRLLAQAHGGVIAVARHAALGITAVLESTSDGRV